MTEKLFSTRNLLYQHPLEQVDSANLVFSGMNTISKSFCLLTIHTA